MKRLIFAFLVFASILLALAVEASAEFSFRTTTLEPSGSIVEDVAVGDVDGVNGPDVVTAYAEGGIGVQLNDGHGHFGPAHMYATGCDVNQVELADVGALPSSILPDGHLDAVIACSYGGGNSIQIGRMLGDGSGGFSAPVMFSESDYGFANGLALSHQGFALVPFRGASGPPAPAWTRLVQTGLEFHRVFCISYDWSTATCAGVGSLPEPYVPLVPGQVAEAELFTYGGAGEELGWGPSGGWHASGRDFGPEPTSKEPAYIWRSITIGDLQGDGPDILTAAGTSGAVPEEPASGRVSVLYGNNAEGVPSQKATTFAAALGVEGIATGDFDLDGHTDVVGSDWHYSASTGGVGGVFFLGGDGAGHLDAPQEVPLYTGERFNYDPVRVADLDGNGAADIVAVVGGEVRVLLNQKTPPPPVTVTPPPGPTPISSLIEHALAGIKKLPKLVRLLPGGWLALGTATDPPTSLVRLTVTIPAGTAKGSALSAAQKRKKPIVIGKAQINVAAGKTVPLKVKLSNAARKLLAKRRSLRATLAIVAFSKNGAQQSESLALTIEPKRKSARK